MVLIKQRIQCDELETGNIIDHSNREFYSESVDDAKIQIDNLYSIMAQIANECGVDGTIHKSIGRDKELRDENHRAFYILDKSLYKMISYNTKDGCKISIKWSIKELDHIEKATASLLQFFKKD